MRFCSNECIQEMFEAKYAFIEDGICKNCGKSFLQKIHNHTFCCTDCITIYRKKLKLFVNSNKIVICKNCNKPILKLKNKVKFCNPNCLKDYYRKYLNIKKPIDRLCPECKSLFKPTVATQIFCSEECHKKQHPRITTIEIKENKKCLNCGKSLNAFHKSDFCSNTCQIYFKCKSLQDMKNGL